MNNTADCAKAPRTNKSLSAQEAQSPTKILRCVVSQRPGVSWPQTRTGRSTTSSAWKPIALPCWKRSTTGSYLGRCQRLQWQGYRHEARALPLAASALFPPGRRPTPAQFDHRHPGEGTGPACYLPGVGRLRAERRLAAPCHQPLPRRSRAGLAGRVARSAPRDAGGRHRAGRLRQKRLGARHSLRRVGARRGCFSARARHVHR